jgi:hypothetical protein
MQQQFATVVQQNRPWQAGMMAPTRPLGMTELDNNNNPLAGGWSEVTNRYWHDFLTALGNALREMVR